jgi:hypothetical protein
MSMNSSGGLQILGTICQLKIETKGCEMSNNFPGNSHNLKFASS